MQTQGAVAHTQRYDRNTIVFHWLTFALVVLQFAGAWTIDLFARGTPRVDARSVHITLGCLLALVLLARIRWRLSRGRHLPPAGPGVLNRLATVMHYALYALLLAMVCVGVSLAWVRGDSLYGLFSLPSPAPGNHALSDQVQNIHATIGWVILAAVGLHAAAALWHRLVLADDVFGRMRPQL